MIPVLFHIWRVPIHSFGLMLVLAFLSSWRLLSIELEEAGKDPALAEKMITWAAVGGLLGARIGYLISFPSDLIAHPLATIFGGAGFVFHWGLLGGALAVWVLLKRSGENFLRMGDLTGASLALGYAIGRIGCQLSGDGDYGKPSDLPWAMEYPLGVVPTPPGVTVHPAPVYETLMALMIAIALRSPAVRRRFSGTGQLFGLYFVLIGLERFLVEFVRIEPVVLPPLTQAQVMSVILMTAGAVLIARCAKSRPV